MTQLSIRAISKKFGAVTAVDNVSLDIASGEFLTLLGASGCGKTTLLRIIAGFTQPDSGELTIDGRQIENLSPSKRAMGFVFQSYALFPTQTVAENVGFSLRIRKWPKVEIAERVAELCRLVRLEGMEERYPHELSGGQQQRVALARALAPGPAILLLDEPLSALDAQIRAHLRNEIRAVVDRLGITTVYVTHDQEEALSISDRVAIMNHGKILQVAPPMEVYLRPAQRYVAEFIGTSNHLAGRLNGEAGVEIEGQLVEVEVPDSLRGQKECLVCVRPEHVIIAPPEKMPGVATATVVAFSFLGQVVRATVRTPGGQELLVDVATIEWLASGFSIGDEVTWRIRSGGALLFGYEDEAVPAEALP
ncbi:MAG: ABC transporter ATP-binding protein [Gammaproteobacteria bacterium]|nr:MAG: ABC transporter ATP-binding protein [Gammaproteobacteria bacterium]